jgi:hypothetical protein
VAEAVVARALLRVGEYGVGFGRLLELLLGRLVAGILVRVVAHRELAVRALDLRLGRAPAHAEDFVIISLCHCVTIRLTTNKITSDKLKGDFNLSLVTCHSPLGLSES